MYKKSRLDNGLAIVGRPMPDRQSVSVGIWIRVGSRYEAADKKGISHFLEHLLFKGTRSYSCRKIKESLEGVGGSLNGFTSEELTCYLVTIPGRYLDLALNVLSDMVLNPTVPEAEVDREKQVILEEIKMYKDQPQSRVHELLDGLLWPGQPLGIPIIGSAELVNRTKRQDLLDFRRASYTPANIVVSAAGALDYNRLYRSAKRIFSKEREYPQNYFIPAREFQSAPQARIFRKDNEQTHISLGFHAFSRSDPSRYALALLQVILGGNMSSRLFNELREKRGLAYEVGAHIRRFYDTGAFTIHAGIDNKKITESLQVIFRELKKIKLNLVRHEEFRRAKDFYLGQLALAMEGTTDNMLWIGESVSTQDKTHTLKETMRRINAIKREDIRAIARKIFNKSKINLAAVGPIKISQKEILNHLTL